MGDVNNIEMDFGRPGGHSYSFMHSLFAQCRWATQKTRTWNLEDPYCTQIWAGTGPSSPRHRCSHANCQSGAETCLLLGRPRAPRVDSDLISYLPSKLPGASPPLA